ncbi:hypothetical protein EN837_08510 [bacterium M00.F.Ca.ET.194.01.1.1]|nr:hypothetical protein EN837_08510 [bacterium M00.F.Ca.ET.194.01.1.1]TGS56300.1 hypothetical protein EN822_08510 [bacterium M00.F.Ca.ET.179.01.1.1]TGV49205.1 hypothetical protein EN811_08510 [bacterium M00.F.Ca.ET.168.01.1.1]
MTEKKRSIAEIMNDITRVCADIDHQSKKFQSMDELSDEAGDRAPYELRLQIGKALDRLICDESTPEQVDKFISTFAEFGLFITYKPTNPPALSE